MAYWWVSQNQTYRQERTGGFLWAPNALRVVAEWSMLGLSFGACFGNVVGRFAWRWLKPENEEVVS